MKNFQLVLLVVFGVIAVLAMLVFAGFIGTPGGDSGTVATGGTVEMWGTIPERDINEFITEFRNENDTFRINYRETNPLSFNRELVEAIARDRGPDIVLFPHELMIENEDLLITIPYETVSQRQFQDTFINASEVLMTPEGIVALPFAIDPVVMYWNRLIFQSAALAEVPKFWSDFFVLTPLLTKQDQRGQIVQSTIALGEDRNINSSKDILTAMFMQTGDKIAERTETGKLKSVFAETNGPATALNFYTEFSDPNKNAYSWNSSLPTSKDYFTSGRLATYLGYMSEYDELKELNPLIDFDVAVIPQIKGSEIRSTYGKLYSLGIVESARDVRLAFTVLDLLAFGEAPEKLNELVGIAPVKRELLANPTDDTIGPVNFESAIITKVWPDPDPIQTGIIFRDIINSTNIRQLTPEQAIGEAKALLSNLIGIGI